MHVLLVEDDERIAAPLVKGLEREGFEVEHVATGAAALGADEPDLVLLDLGLPDIDGYEVCRRLRAASDVPIIVTTARGEEVDRVVGLELGADDYLVKPFGFRELVARIRAVTRRTERAVARATDQAAPSSVRWGDLDLDVRTRRAQVGGRDVELTRKEFDLLAVLMRDPGATVRREEILDEVWDTHWFGSTKTLDVHVASLRKKLGTAGLIETVRGVGYRMGEVEPARTAAPPA